MRGAFVVSDPNTVADQHILLIDDVLTTGATARAAAKALKSAGAASVWVATLARARRYALFRRGENAFYDLNMEEIDNHADFGGDSAVEFPQPASLHSSSNQPSS